MFDVSLKLSNLPEHRHGEYIYFAWNTPLCDAGFAAFLDAIPCDSPNFVQNAVRCIKNAKPNDAPVGLIQHYICEKKSYFTDLEIQLIYNILAEAISSGRNACENASPHDQAVDT